MKNRKYLYWLVWLLVCALSLGHITPVFAQEGTAPVISGAPIVIEIGGTYDPLAGITITDDVDSEADLLARLEYFEDVDTGWPGVYYIYYYVADSDHNSNYLDRLVFVLDPELPLIRGGYAEIAMGDPFDPMSNVYAWDLKDGDLTPKIIITSDNVDTNTPGEYAVYYSVTDTDGNTAEAMKWVYVGYPSQYYPTITAEDLIVRLGDEVNYMQGVNATDINDGDIIANVTIEKDNVDPTTPGMYWAYYSVHNELGLYNGIERRIIIIDPAASPVIFVQEAYLETGMYFDPYEYAFAYDLEDGNISHLIQVTENNVDMSQPGDYTVTYRVKDSADNIAETTAMFFVYWSQELVPRINFDQDPLYLGLNAEFDPRTGVTASDQTDGDLTSEIIIEENIVDTSVAGRYYVVYSVTNSLHIQNHAWLQVFVLEDSKPRIFAYDFSSGVNQELEIYMAEFEAYDLEDGNLWDAVTWDISQVDITQAGTYPITFMVYDSDGNYAEAISFVTIIDYSYPQLEIWDHQAYLGEAYDPLDYAQAWDMEDGEISDQIEVIKNTVKINKLGTYFVTYSVTNSLGKTTTATVTVEVVKEPVYTYFITYLDEMIPLEIDNMGEIAMLRSPVDIPAGSEIGFSVYIDGEPTYEFDGLPVVNDIMAGVTYSIFLDEAGLFAEPMMPYLYNGIGFRTTALKGEVRFTATSGGTIHYVVGNVGSELPEIDTTQEGIPGTAGLNTLKLTGLKPGKAQIVRILIEVPEVGISNIIEITLPRTPSGPVIEKIKPNKP